MIKQPLVSVIAINYNNSKYVIETLDSIAKQTYRNIELIIVDDCSVDNSLELIEQWLITYNQSYQIIKHVKNEGVCKTINDGYKLAKGKYISSIATDDTMLSEKIEKQVELLEQSDNDVGMVYSDAYLIDEDGESLDGCFIQRYKPELSKVPSGDIYEELLKRNYIPAMSIMIKKEIFSTIDYFDEDLDYEDYDMWLRIAEKYKIVYSKYISVKYRIRENSLTTIIVSELWFVNNIKIYRKHKDINLIAKQKYVTLLQNSFFENIASVHEYLNTIQNNQFRIMKKMWNMPFFSHKNKVYLYKFMQIIKVV